MKKIFVFALGVAAGVLGTKYWPNIVEKAQEARKAALDKLNELQKEVEAASAAAAQEAGKTE